MAQPDDWVSQERGVECSQEAILPMLKVRSRSEVSTLSNHNHLSLIETVPMLLGPCVKKLRGPLPYNQEVA